MGRVKKQNGKSSIKKLKKNIHLQRTYLPRASEDPNRRHKVAEKVIDHKNEELHVWYLIRFKDMTRPQWLPENSISGCKQLIQEYWIRENAMKKIDVDTDNNYDYQSSTIFDYSKHDKPQPSYNSHAQTESYDQSSSYSRSESFSPSSSQSRIKSRSQFYYESDVESRNSDTSSQYSGDQISQKLRSKVTRNSTINSSATHSIRYGEKRRASLAVAEITENKDNLESNHNIATSKESVLKPSSLAKGKNKSEENFVTQLRQKSGIGVEGVQLQSKDPPKSVPNEFFPETRPFSMQSHSTGDNELTIIPSVSSNITWSGNIIKGSLVLFVASVNIVPFPGRCDNVAALEKIANEKVSELCIQHSLPLSYALNLIKDKDVSKYSVFEIKQSQNIKSRHNVSVEKTIMMRSKIVGVIWIEEYQTAWIIFPYCERICNLLKLPDKKEIKLFTVSISVPPRFDPLPLNFEPEPLILPNYGRFLVEEIVKTKTFLRQTGYYSHLLQLLRICKDQIHFTYFGNEEFPDIQELLLAMKVLGAIYEENYSENISFVFVHILFLKQLLFMRNFMDFKRLSNCKFLIFGTDLRESPEPICFKEHLPKGGMLSVTTYTFLQEEQVSSRIMDVIDYQRTTQDALWDYLLYVNVTDNLADIGQSQNNERALRAWHEAMTAIGTRKARYIKNEEIFMPDKIPEEPPPMVSSLYRTMLRIHTIYAAKRRDFILIRHDDEEELVNEPIPGVWKMSLQEFEQIFGPTKQ